MTTKLAWLSVLYRERTSYSADLHLHSSITDDTTSITIIHERSIDGPVCHELVVGNDELDLIANDGESLTVIMRGEDDGIVACGIFEVQVNLAEELGAILAPRATTNLFLDQCDAAIVAHATDRALEACTTNTGELIVSQEALQ